MLITVLPLLRGAPDEEHEHDPGKLDHQAPRRDLRLLLGGQLCQAEVVEAELQVDLLHEGDHRLVDAHASEQARVGFQTHEVLKQVQSQAESRGQRQGPAPLDVIFQRLAIQQSAGVVYHVVILTVLKDAEETRPPQLTGGLHVLLEQRFLSGGERIATL